jgi:CubicO group peptidase (beta-lactamase class C family)
MADGSVGGFSDSKFAAAAEAFQANLDRGDDLGASFCATVNGEVVVDLWGGWADETRTRPWVKDTIVNVYSTTKTMTALTALMIADRGLIDFDAPVARYWPEFAQNGKEGVKVRHLMAHSSGLFGWTEKTVVEDIYDWDKACARLAVQAPSWPPGTAPGYHALTQGNLVGEVVRRVTGKSLGTVFKEEIAEPLGADFYIGLPASEDLRVADLIPPVAALPDIPPSDYLVNIMTNPPIDPLDTRTRAWRAAEIPAANGHGNARSIAQVHAILANGGAAQGKRFLSEAGCRAALVPQVEGMDLVLGFPARYGLGFGLPDMIPMKNPNSMFWGGYGGSLIIIDMDAKTTFAYAMNKMGTTTIGDERAMSIVRAMWSAL